jgi:enoyl-CoA hydratase
MAATGDIVFTRQGGVGIATLNRPQALNALTLDMFGAYDPQLAQWSRDADVHAVLVRGAGDRAFCAGGDVRRIYDTRNTPPVPGDYKFEMYRREYLTIRRLHRLQKPYVALAHGLTLGGGMGISVNGTFCVATDGVEFGMPEVFIGTTPDVAATRFLHRCPGQIGMYLALTGGRLPMPDAIASGIATHYVPRDRFVALTGALTSIEFRAGRERDQVAEVLSRFAERPPDPTFRGVQPEIDRCFGRGSVEEILAALRSETGEWAKQALAAMQRASPLSLKLTFRQMRMGSADMPVEEALALEFRIVQHILPRGDMYEGVRALLVDKDKKPRWRFASVEQVPDEEVESCFASLGDRELRF